MTGMKKACGLAFVCALAAGIAQQMGSVTGVVTDAADAPIPGAGIRVWDAATRFERKGRSDSQGRYRLVVPPGHYELQVDALGFRSVRQMVAVSGGSTTRVDVRLEVGSVT